MPSIIWLTNWRQAFDSAESTQKPVLLDIFNPESIGCQQMDAITYSSKDVVSFINTHLTPLRVKADEVQEEEIYRHIWTPTLVILNLNGREVQRTIGFLNPNDFIAVMHLGLAKIRLDAGKLDTAIIPLESLLETFYHNNYLPEAIYLSGITRYKLTHDKGKLKETYARLHKEYPDNIWTKRADPFRLL